MKTLIPWNVGLIIVMLVLTPFVALWAAIKGVWEWWSWIEWK